MSETTYKRRPHWLKVKLPSGQNFYKVKDLVKGVRLHTVCESAHCPNLGECWGRRTATFMILGDVCSRNCGFCAVTHGRPEPLDPDEPNRVAEAVDQLELRYAVITSVTRDDLPDGGAQHFVDVIETIRSRRPRCRVEVLIPDFQGDESALDRVLEASPFILNHNIETVQRLYSQVRPQADYHRALELLQRACQKKVRTKSGLMVGLGETKDEVMQTMKDLRRVGCSVLTIGQYLQPSRLHLPVHEFVHPDEFKWFKKRGLDMGFSHVESGPLVRSSYHADEPFRDHDSDTD